MNELKKDVSESDPKSIDEHREHEIGSFMDIYRSLSIQDLQMDTHFVEKCVENGVVPSSLRYGSMVRGSMKVYRGVVKSSLGEAYYFNWTDGTDFKLVKADDATKVWEAGRLYESCAHGCDMRKADAPIDPAESIEEDDEDDVEKTPAGLATISEEQSIQEQTSLLTDVHPGAARGQTSDDPLVGRQWHAEKALSRPSDGATPVATNDGSQHWSAPDLMKAWGRKLQSTAPNAAPPRTSLETKFMKEMMGATDAQISKGLHLPPRHRVSFEQWKATRLRGRLDGLKSWLKDTGE